MQISGHLYDISYGLEGLSIEDTWLNICTWILSHAAVT